MPSSEFRRVLLDRKSTRLNSSHTIISYAAFCLKKKRRAAAHRRPRRRPVHARALARLRRVRADARRQAGRPRRGGGGGTRRRCSCFFFNGPGPRRRRPPPPPPPFP